MSQSAIDVLSLRQFGCTRPSPMHEWTASYRTKARASHDYGVYPDAVMRLERYGRDGREFILRTDRPFGPVPPEIEDFRSGF
jgi:hypothetical protein